MRLLAQTAQQAPTRLADLQEIRRKRSKIWRSNQEHTAIYIITRKDTRCCASSGKANHLKPDLQSNDCRPPSEDCMCWHASQQRTCSMLSKRPRSGSSPRRRADHLGTFILFLLFLFVPRTCSMPSIRPRSGSSPTASGDHSAQAMCAQRPQVVALSAPPPTGHRQHGGGARSPAHKGHENGNGTESESAPSCCKPPFGCHRQGRAQGCADMRACGDVQTPHAPLGTL